jgi:lysophospholipase L1-like esterase
MTMRAHLLHLAAPLIAAVALFTPSAIQAQPIQHTCNLPGLGTYEVLWNQGSFYGTPAYSVTSVRAGASTSTNGWTLHHRPVANYPNNTFDPDTFVIGSAIIGYSVWDGLIPTIQLGFGPQRRTSILTCPNGVCVFSPHDGCKRTYQGPVAARKVAVAGDSLIWGNDMCPFNPPPEGCAPTTTAVLQGQGFRVWSETAPGQGFLSWLPELREQATTRPDVFVMAFATNDAGNAAALPPDQRVSRVWATLFSVFGAIDATRTANPNACVVLVTASKASVINGQFAPNYATEAGRVNDILFAADQSYSNIQVVDWDAATRAHCPATWLTQPTTTCDWFTGDQLHLARAGHEARNALLVQAIARCGT